MKKPSSLVGLKAGAHIHLMGICGTAMASLAGLLQGRGYRITGSDSNPYPPMSTQLEKLGIQILKGYKKDNLNPRPDFVVVGNVISASNEEAIELDYLGIPFTSLPMAMGELILEKHQAVVVAGTHGKTTTTSLMSWVLDQSGLEPGFLIGGIPKNFSLSFRNPKGPFFVIEGDEYDTAFFDKVPKFVHYRPKHVILTSIEFDHADIYENLDAVKAAFSKLMDLIPENGTLVYCSDDKNVIEQSLKCRAHKKISYGFNPTASYRAEILSMTDLGTDFRVVSTGFSDGRIFRMKMGGKYNVLNALAVLAMSEALKVTAENVAGGLSSFDGVKRRQEILGEPSGILVIEDFAHHPTAVRETIQGIQAKYPGRKFFSVFEPRSATSRRKVFQKDYLEAFTEAHESLLAEAFDQSKIDSQNRFSSQELVAELNSQGKKASVFQSSDQIVDYLKAHAKSGDGILIMSNGGFDGIYQKLLSRL